MASLPLSWPHGTVILLLMIGCITLGGNAKEHEEPTELPSCSSAGAIHSVSVRKLPNGSPTLELTFTVCSGCDATAREAAQPTRNMHSSSYRWIPAVPKPDPTTARDCELQIEMNSSSDCCLVKDNNVSQELSASGCGDGKTAFKINFSIKGKNFCARSSLTASTCSTNLTLCHNGTRTSHCQPQSFTNSQENCPPVPHTNSTTAINSPVTTEYPKTMALAPELISPTVGNTTPSKTQSPSSSPVSAPQSPDFQTDAATSSDQFIYLSSGSTSVASPPDIAEATQRVCDGGSHMTIILMFLIVVTVALLAENVVLVYLYRMKAIKITRNRSHVSLRRWSPTEANGNEHDLNNVVYANHTADNASTTARSNRLRSVVRPTMLAVGSPIGLTKPDDYAFPHDMIDSDSRSMDMRMTLTASQRDADSEVAHYQLPLDRIATPLGCGAAEAGNEYEQPSSSEGNTLNDELLPHESKLEATNEQVVRGQQTSPKCNASVNQQGTQTTACTTDTTYEAICGTGDDSTTDSPANRIRRPYATIYPEPATGHHGRKSALRRGQTGSFENSIYDGTGEIEIAFNINPTAEP